MPININYCSPSQEDTEQEKFVLKLVRRHRKLFAFLREHRLKLFDSGFQKELIEMYRETGAGKQPITPALMGMALLLQGYTGDSDAEVVALTAADSRWQMVLGCLGATAPAFSQGALWAFRDRLIRTGMDRRLLERTVELAKKYGGFDWKKLPKKLLVAMDASPLEGAGRVEDTINLLAHAARKLVSAAATAQKMSFSEVATEAGIPLLLESSVKAGLDRQWDKPGATSAALADLVEQLDSLEAWVAEKLPEGIARPEVEKSLETLSIIREQDIAEESGAPEIRQATAKDRQISIEDNEMRHGRKSRSRKINGYKRHIAMELTTSLILACAVKPANQAESDGADDMAEDIKAQGRTIDELFIDRGYLASSLVPEVDQRGVVICRSWPVCNNNGLFSKVDFNINVRDKAITCPGGQTKPIEFGKTVKFDAKVCDKCPMRSECTTAQPGRGRTVHIAADEKLQKRLRKKEATAKGREQLRKRVAVEHKLAHISQRQGNRARYKGTRKNLFDLRRAAAIQNLETIQRVGLGRAKAA